MWLSIHAEPLPIDEGIYERIERRLGFALSRFGDRIGHVTVHLNDVNGPRGGIDQRGLNLEQTESIVLTL